MGARFVRERESSYILAPARFIKFTCRFGELLERTGTCGQQKEFIVNIIYRKVYNSTSERKKRILLVGFFL